MDLDDEVIPCDSENCEIDGFFHIGCMVAFKDWDAGDGVPHDAYICKTCHAMGKQPFVDEGDKSEESFEDWTREDEFEHRMVAQHGNLKVGMPMRGGHVQEIYPGLNKFTIATQASTGGCRIEHLSIDEHEGQGIR